MDTSNDTPLKKCSKCPLSFPNTDEFFYKRKKRKDGTWILCAYCKTCHAKISARKMSEWQKKHPERVRKIQRKYRRSEEGKKAIAKRRKGRPLKTVQRAARAAVREAVRIGNMPKVSSLRCVQCGEPAAEYHHASYNTEDWLKVIPICKTCHIQLHHPTYSVD